jgi:uncharacterized protein YbjT (DUF2867 family)
VSRITVIGGTGYAGSAIAAEAAARGHQVTALSRSLPDAPIPNVTYVQGDASDEATLSAPIAGADVVVGALAPRGPLAGTFRDVYAAIARLADAAGVPCLSSAATRRCALRRGRIASSPTSATSLQSSTTRSAPGRR